MPVNDGHPHGQGRSAHHLLIQKWHYCPISCCAKCDLSIFPKPNHYPPHALLVCRLLLTVHWYDHSEDTQSSIVALYLSPPANQNLFPIFFPCKHPVYLGSSRCMDCRCAFLIQVAFSVYILHLQTHHNS